MNMQQVYPPWYEIVTLLYYTLGQDNSVHIMEPQEGVSEGCEKVLDLGIVVEYRQQAECIRVILPKYYRTGNTVLCTHIYCNEEEIIFTGIAQKNQRDIASVFCNALHNNPLFRGVSLVPQTLIPLKSMIQVAVIPKNLPVNLEGYTGYSKTMSVAEAFSQVIKRQYGTLLTTVVCFKSCGNKELREIRFFCKGSESYICNDSCQCSDNCNCKYSEDNSDNVYHNNKYNNNDIYPNNKCNKGNIYPNNKYNSENIYYNNNHNSDNIYHNEKNDRVNNKFADEDIYYSNRRNRDNSNYN
ncbi:MAG: hypothetical protein ACRCSG_00810 [Cellulosilyticaceae bacterium]